MQPLSIVKWLKESGIKNEKGEPLDYKDRLFLLNILADWSQEIVIKKSAQIGGSVTFNIKVLFAIKYLKINVIYTFPTASDVSEFVVSKTNKLLQANPDLFKGMQTDNVERKEIDGRFLFFKGTVSDTAPIMTSADLLVHDEVSRSDQKTLEDYKSRTKASNYKGRWLFSNPTTEKDILDQQWQLSDKKEWVITCKCGFEQVLVWPDSIDKDRKCYQCVACKEPLSDEVRRMGKWVAQDPAKAISGYHISLLMAPWITAAEIIKDSEGDQEYFYNFVLGEPYNPGDLRVSRSTILDNWTPKSLVTGNYYLGVDVGNIKHYVLGSEKGVIKVGRFSKWSELDDLITHYKIRSGVIDAMPDNTMSKYYVEQYPQMMMSFFQENLNNPQAVVWYGENDKQGIVYSSRDRAIDRLIYEIINAKILFGLPSDYDFREYLKHWETLRRVKETNAKGIERYIWDSTTGEDHFCFVANTKILTNKGQKNIQDIQIGDKVLTREGFKKVMCTMNRLAGVIDTGILKGTADHPIWVDKQGFKDLQAMLYSDTIRVCKYPLLTKALSFADILNQKIEQSEFTSLPAQEIKLKGLADFTRKFIRIILAQSQKVLQFIIKTIIPLIIRPITWGYYQEANTKGNTLRFGSNNIRNKILSIYREFTQKCGQLWQNGALARLARSNYGIMLTEQSSYLNQRLLSVLNVAEKALPGQDKVESSVANPVRPVGTQGNGVRKNLNTGRGIERVYNFEVEDSHEYFANNVLVSNCFATLYYWLALQGQGTGKYFAEGVSRIPQLIKETSKGPVMGSLDDLLSLNRFDE